jgi:hypothetical protein
MNRSAAQYAIDHAVGAISMPTADMTEADIVSRIGLSYKRLFFDMLYADPFNELLLAFKKSDSDTYYHVTNPDGHFSYLYGLVTDPQISELVLFLENINRCITGDISSIATMVNTIIPQGRKVFSYLINGSTARVRLPAPRYIGQFPVESVKDIPWCYPPKYSKGAVLRTAIISAVVLTTTAVVGLKVKRAIGNRISRRIYNKRRRVDDALARYTASGSQQDWNDYMKSVRSYNRVARFTGNQTISWLSRMPSPSSVFDADFTRQLTELKDIRSLIR